MFRLESNRGALATRFARGLNLFGGNQCSDEKFDVILCLGSVNFGPRDKILAEVGRCVNLLADNGTMFFRVNPGVQHDKPEAKWIEFFAWNVPFIIELSEMFNLKVLDIRDDTNQRKYFVYRKLKQAFTG